MLEENCKQAVKNSVPKLDEVGIFRKIFQKIKIILFFGRETSIQTLEEGAKYVQS